MVFHRRKADGKREELVVTNAKKVGSLTFILMFYRDRNSQVSKIPMKRSTFFSFLATLVLGLLLTAAGGFYWIISHSPLSLLQNNKVVDPTAVMFVPKQAPLMVSLLVNPDKLEAFRLVGMPLVKRSPASAEFNQIKENLLANTGIDYGRDIRPWLGDEITFAITTKDIDRNSENGEKIGILIALATENSERSRKFLDSFWQKQAVASQNLMFEQYKGVKLTYNDAVEDSAWATGLVGDRFVLFANDPKVLRDAINNVQVPKLNLNNTPEYQQFLERVTPRQIGFTFVNLPELKAAFGNAVEAEYSPTSFAIGFGLDAAGLLAKTALLTENSDESFRLPVFSEPIKALEYLPISSSIAIASRDLSQLSTGLSAAITSGNPFANLLDKSLSNLEEKWGIELEKDIFSWVKGEYALGLLPSSEGNQPNWIFVTEKSPSSDAEVDRLDAIAKERGYNLTPLNLENQEVSVWTKLITTREGDIELKAKVGGTHVAVGNYEIFATSVEAMDEALKAPENSLFDSKDFQASIDRISHPNQGYLYLNWRSAQDLLESKLPVLNVVDAVAKPLLDNLQSIAFTSYGSEDNVSNGSAFLRFDDKNFRF